MALASVLAVVGVAAMAAPSASAASGPQTLFSYPSYSPRTDPKLLKVTSDASGSAVTITFVDPAINYTGPSLKVAAPTGKALVVGKLYTGTTSNGAGGTPLLGFNSCGSGGQFVLDQFDRGATGEVDSDRLALRLRRKPRRLRVGDGSSRHNRSLVRPPGRAGGQPVRGHAGRFDVDRAVPIVIRNTGPSPLAITKLEAQPATDGQRRGRLGRLHQRHRRSGGDLLGQPRRHASRWVRRQTLAQLWITDSLTASGTQGVAALSMVGLTPGPDRYEVDSSSSAEFGCGTTRFVSTSAQLQGTTQEITVSTQAWADPNQQSSSLSFSPGPAGPMRAGLTFPVAGLGRRPTPTVAASMSP